MCFKNSKHDVALSMSRLTGKSYENSLMDLNRVDKPSVFNSFGNLDIQGFGRMARSEGASNLAVTKEVSRLTSMSFENSLMALNMIPLKPLK
ncbi:hypothetical protein ACFL03_13340 [Thermodesulfobacteriota bacterium]